MTTSTLSAASAALNSLLSAGNLAPSVSKPRRKKTNAKRSTDIADTADLDPAARAQREAEGQKKVDEAVKALRRSGTVKKEELEVRERVGCSVFYGGNGAC